MNKLGSWANGGFIMYQNSLNERIWGISANSTWYTRTASNIPENSWQFFAGTYSIKSGEMKHYLNSTVFSTAFPTNVNINNAQPLIIMTNTGIGYIDNIRIYNRALLASEIFQIYNQTKGKYQ